LTQPIVKSGYAIAYADAFTAALAQPDDVIVVTDDPESNSVAGQAHIEG
jgi:hypothetical protein